MRPTSIPALLAVLVLSGGVGAALSATVAARGGTVPVAGWLTGVLLLALAVVLVVLGLPLRRYLRESEERRLAPTSAPRHHQIDLPSAYRTVLLARSAALTGSVVGGLFAGEALQLAGMGGGDLLRALLPTAFAAAAGVVLAVVGVIVERWGMLPPDDGAAGTEGSAA